MKTSSGISVFSLFFISMILVGCAPKHSLDKRTSIEPDDKYLQYRCVPLQSDFDSLYISIDILSFELSFSPNAQQLQIEMPIIPGFVKVGVQNNIPSSDYLYLVIENRNWENGKEKRTYCIDPGGRTLEIIPNAKMNSSLRFFVGKNNFAVGFDSEKIIQYQTSGNYHWLYVDITSGEIADFEIKPVTPYPKRAIKPEEGMEHCTAMRRDKSQKPFINVAIVCASDSVEDAIGWTPSVLAHIHPYLGGISLFIVYFFLFGLLIMMIKKQPDNWQGIVFTLLLVAFVCWLLLLLSNILPYALM